MNILSRICDIRPRVKYMMSHIHDNRPMSVKAPLRVLYVIYCTRGAVERPIHAQGKAECCIGTETVPQVQ